ncbi:uncharacterized protein WCI35_029752, partial [Daubentonia madagascariensis]
MSVSLCGDQSCHCLAFQALPSCRFITFSALKRYLRLWTDIEM